MYMCFCVLYGCVHTIKYLQYQLNNNNKSLSKLFPVIPPASWPVHLAARLVCLASVHITRATVVSNGHAHLDCNGYFYTMKHAHAHTHTSNGLISPAKHSTPTSEHFERGATLPPRVLGSLYGHHHDPLCHPDHV